MNPKISETSQNIAWLFDKIKNIDEQVKRYSQKDDFMLKQFHHQKNEFLKELNDYLAKQHYDLQVNMNQN